jgi:hypothetical protein
MDSRFIHLHRIPWSPTPTPTPTGPAPRHSMFHVGFLRLSRSQPRLMVLKVATHNLSF